jgi:hypothetical protein
MQKFPFEYHMAGMPDQYFLALGRMQHAFTCLEVALTTELADMVLCHPLKVWDNRTVIAVSAVLGNIRINESTASLKRLFRVLNVRKEIRDFADEIFKQITEIQNFRNRLTHYKTEPLGGEGNLEYFNCDVGSTKELARSRTFEFDLTTIDYATLDILTIMGIMSDITVTIEGPQDYRPFVLPAWQYKPSMLVETGPQSFQNPLPLLPPHEASAE